MKNKIECLNCGAVGPKAYTVKKLETMTRAGFALRHLSCRSCGQKTLRKERI